ncbi:MAG: SRPBCC family protein [Actinomycetota bacterium]|nr:SRPBCC family protein [Actinomycetota bacterium]
MAVNEIHIDAPPGRVFDLLTTGRRYAEWVVGAKRIRAVDDNWPQPGSQFHHTVGIGPFAIADNTKVLQLDPPGRILLEARVRPFGRAEVELVVESDGPGSRVRMREEPTRGPDVLKRLLEPTIRSRNAEALRRLRELCERPS